MEMGFIVESDRDEYRAVIEIRKRLMSENSGLTSATILLTTACNATVHYIYLKKPQIVQNKKKEVKKLTSFYVILSSLKN